MELAAVGRGSGSPSGQRESEEPLSGVDPWPGAPPLVGGIASPRSGGALRPRGGHQGLQLVQAVLAAEQGARGGGGGSLHLHVGNGGQHEAAERLASRWGCRGACLEHPGPFLLSTKLSEGGRAPSSEGEAVQEALQERASAARGCGRRPSPSESQNREVPPSSCGHDRGHHAPPLVASVCLPTHWAEGWLERVLVGSRGSVSPSLALPNGGSLWAFRNEK